MTRGELRKQLEIQLSKAHGLDIPKTDVIRFRRLAARLAA